MKPKLVNRTVVEHADKTPSSNLKMVKVEDTPRNKAELHEVELSVLELQNEMNRTEPDLALSIDDTENVV